VSDSPYIVTLADCAERNPFPGVWMHTTEGEQMTLSVVDMEPHAVIPEHSHPHEQVGFMVQGEAEFIIAGKSCPVRAGQMWRLPGGTPHKVTAGPLGIRAFDVFYPVREDYRAKRRL
jgi:quercetin dioxygenase-like cupin family protein